VSLTVKTSACRIPYAQNAMSRGVCLSVLPTVRFEPPAALVHQADHRNRCSADEGSEQRNVVELRFWIGIENFVAAQCLQPSCFIRREWGRHSRSGNSAAMSIRRVMSSSAIRVFIRNPNKSAPCPLARAGTVELLS
jgi:hypothetical protein